VHGDVDRDGHGHSHGLVDASIVRSRPGVREAPPTGVTFVTATQVHAPWHPAGSLVRRGFGFLSRRVHATV
jgi:hypothetical protein